ncbi:PREDICTED: glutamate receptor ionotropic, NMDA 2C-like [Priapulus caudatus]|uniref:Glutamate receptor ionotropic, NMDA 2C-like n=1 Tax=Priapulus caudatus TaxID=37621 RepID=A0ABM1ESF8_PRICU|nr:PREDICTED: glutamate receptor ionotropic, NMDA 2C-like [Priapulus caudatus]
MSFGQKPKKSDCADFVSPGEMYLQQSKLPVRLDILKQDNASDWHKVDAWQERELYNDNSDVIRQLAAFLKHKDQHLRVVTKEENPFVIISEPHLDVQGRCIGGAKCFTYEPSPRPPGRHDNDTEEEEELETDNMEEHIMCCSGFSIDLLEAVRKKMDFTYTLYRVKDQKWGTVEKGRWVGVMGDVVYGYADMAFTSLKITKSRSKIVDFSMPVLETGISVLVPRKPGRISPSAFLEPYDLAAWIIVLLVGIHVFASVTFFFEWLSPYGYNRDKTNPRGILTVVHIASY